MSSSSRSSSPSSEYSFSGSSSSLYVPVHKRSHSRGSSTVTTPPGSVHEDSFMKSFRHSESNSESTSTPAPTLPIYTRAELLRIGEHSALVHDAIDEEVLSAVFVRLPDIHKVAVDGNGRGRSSRRHPHPHPHPHAHPKKEADAHIPPHVHHAPAAVHAPVAAAVPTSTTHVKQTADSEHWHEHAFPNAFTRQRVGRPRTGRPGVRNTRPAILTFMNEPSWRHEVPLHA